ncbi:MAG: hypothetical protein ACP5MI_07105 [Candidatus Kryptoniota bacterium]
MVILITSAAFCGLVAFFSYHKIEGITTVKRQVLIALRFVSLLLTLLISLNAVVYLTHHYWMKKTVVVMVDDSRSMTLKDPAGTRGEVVREILTSKQFSQLKEKFNLHMIAFGNRLSTITSPDSLQFNEYATDIDAPILEAIKQSISHPIAFAMLISDGNYNSGSDPRRDAREMPFPIYTIGVGDTLLPKDLFVRQVIAPGNIYNQKRTTVRGVISANGLAGKKVTAYLYEDRKMVDSKAIVLPEEGDIVVSFDYLPKAEGQHVLTVSVPPLTGEYDNRNNSLSVSVTVKNGKYSVLLVAGEPQSDFAFIRRNLESSEDFVVTALVQRNAQNFYEKDAGKVLSLKYDAVVLCDFPNSNSGETFGDVERLLKEQNPAVMYFAGRNFDPALVNKVYKMPVKITGFNSGESQVSISPASEEDIPISEQGIYNEIVENVQFFPPLYYQVVNCEPQNDAVVLAYPVLNGLKLKNPLFVVSLKERAATFLGYGIWKLQLMSSVSGLRPDFLHDFLTGTLRALINGNQTKQLTVKSDKLLYDPTEPISFSALLFNQAGKNVSNAAVSLVIKQNQQIKSQVILSPSGGGAYDVTTNPLPEGKYSYVATAMANGAIVGVDSGRFAVESENIEFTQTKMNVDLLKGLSAETGGKFLTPGEFFARGIDLKSEWLLPVEKSNSENFELISNLPLLIVIILTLSSEWVIRKTSGLP